MAKEVDGIFYRKLVLYPELLQMGQILLSPSSEW